MTGWPRAAECRGLYDELGADPALVAHVEAVARTAVPIAQAIVARGHTVDIELVEAGAWLHDLGRTRTAGFDHALRGAMILRARGLPEALCLVVERHTGGGIDPGEATRLGLPVKDYTPRTLEEKIVCHADNLVDGAARQKVQEELTHLRGRGLDGVARKIEDLHRDLSALAGRDLDEIR